MKIQPNMYVNIPFVPWMVWVHIGKEGGRPAGHQIYAQVKLDHFPKNRGEHDKNILVGGFNRSEKY